MSQTRKKVLMFCPTFFGYENRIAEAFRDEGFDVALYNERPNNGFVCKTALRLNLKFYKRVVTNYIKKIIEGNDSKSFDFILVVKGEAISEKEITLLKKAYPNAKTVLYLWDSVANVPDGEKKLDLYDRVLTFDPVDAEKYNIKLRPLFFGPEYENNSQTINNENYLYDFAFIGTAHTDRARIVKKLADECKVRGTKSFSYLFLPHKMVYFYNKITNVNYKNVRLSDICFAPLKASEITEVYKDSRCILDVEHTKQRGLTMRTIEMLGMGKKIITTNSYIESYDFYNPNNIYLINRNSPHVSDNFWTSNYEPVPQDIYNKYTIKSFVCELLDEEN